MFGTKSDVVASLPAWMTSGGDQVVGDFIARQIQRIPDPAPGAPWDAASHVMVEGHGHAGNVGLLKIDGLNPITPPPPPAPPISNEFVAPGTTPFSP